LCKDRIKKDKKLGVRENGKGKMEDVPAKM
jgi:hypothetical protein